MTLDEYCSRKKFKETSNSTCYLIGKERDRVLKLFKQEKRLEDADRIKYFLEYQNDSFILPEEFIVYENRFLGYITKKSNGIELFSKLEDFDLLELARQSKILEQNIDNMSLGKIIMEDISTRNILCEKDSLKVIDPDYYRINRKISEEEAIKINRQLYKESILHLLISCYLNKCKIADTNILKYIKEYLNNDVVFSEAIIAVKEDIENYCNKEIDTVKTFTKVVRR